MFALICFLGSEAVIGDILLSSAIRGTIFMSIGLIGLYALRRDKIN